MEIEKTVKIGDDSCVGIIDEPTRCPVCKYAIKPVELHISGFRDEKKNAYISALYLCKSCFRTFLALHECEAAATYSRVGVLSGHTFKAKMLYCEPNRFTKKDFPREITGLSPKFDTIYNQALAAECSNLDEIAGLGYRKAVEFLVKDFAIHEHPEKEEDIKSMMLSPCIEKYIDAPQIKTLATKSAWIGNDEAHYVRHHPTLDVEDMKRFIHALVSYISMLLTVEEANQIQRA